MRRESAAFSELGTIASTANADVRIVQKWLYLAQSVHLKPFQTAPDAVICGLGSTICTCIVFLSAVSGPCGTICTYKRGLGEDYE